MQVPIVFFARVATLAGLAYLIVVEEGAPLRAVKIESRVLEPVCEQETQDVIISLQNAADILMPGLKPVVKL